MAKTTKQGGDTAVDLMDGGPAAHPGGASPGPLVFFVKTNKAFHQGGFLFSDRDEFDAAAEVLRKEAAHLIQSEQEKDANVEFQSWGALDLDTGELVVQFDTDPSK